MIPYVRDLILCYQFWNPPRLFLHDGFAVLWHYITKNFPRHQPRLKAVKSWKNQDINKILVTDIRNALLLSIGMYSTTFLISFLLNSWMCFPLVSFWYSWYSVVHMNEQVCHLWGHFDSELTSPESRHLLHCIRKWIASWGEGLANVYCICIWGVLWVLSSARCVPQKRYKYWQE